MQPAEIKDAGCTCSPPKIEMRGMRAAAMVLAMLRRRPATRSIKIQGRVMKISTEDVLKVAALANLELTHSEVETYRGQLDEILTYIDKLNEIDTSNVEPMTQVVALSTDDTPLREDVVVRADVITEVLQGAPDPAAPYFRVPRVIEK
jgi:aspartyl-tRNA(Asn)/glutamyl-tRNA(Gln) amidotransferase subunit C